MENFISRQSSKKFKSNSGDWISPSFECESAFVDKRSSYTSRRPKTSSKYFPRKGISTSKENSKSRPSFDIPWTEVFSPNTKDELAVHKKKIIDVEDWLRRNLKLCAEPNLKMAPILLLTGPTGVGKTATIKALAKQFDFEINEWSSNPYESVPNLLYVDGVRQHTNAMIDAMSQSQTTVFQNFLLRANKYQSLLSKNIRRIILIEEFPNVYLRDSPSFHALLRYFSKCGKCPAVFIVSDCTSGSSLENMLFPKDLQSQLQICNVSFNPIAPTMLIRALNRIALSKKECFNGISVSKSDLEEIASNCRGDIRNAINAMQFLAVGKKNFSSNGKRTYRKNQCKRDTSLFLFHALGKILYCKRDSALKKPNYCQLPAHLITHDRVPLVANPEEVFEKTSLSAEAFSLFLHENYLPFTEDIDISSNCASSFSDADIVSIEWNSHGELDKYSASIASRGLMFNLKPNNSVNKWKALHKPQFYNNRKEVLSSSSMVRRTFQETRLSLKEIQTELIPYLEKIRPALNDGQVRTVNKIGKMNTLSLSRLKIESLCEKDIIEDYSSSLVDTNGLATFADANDASNTLGQDSDDEIIIEECEF